jgi:non-canonical purine NTP pyrophosphatase (RdgB/HAM1 family)
MKILIATQNKGKIKEYRRLFADTCIEFVGLADVGLADMEVDETGTTFEENAVLKTKSYAQVAQLWTMADDSGLMVDALGGAPGVYSARYGGADLDHAGKRAKMLGEIADVSDEERGAKFVCVIGIAKPNEDEVTLVRGECLGTITRQEYDEGNGFGYDPIFKPNGHDKTFGQMPSDMKNGLSHRAIAAEKALPILKTMLQDRL